MHKYLSNKHIKNILLAGTTTPNCIRSTAYDAVSYDYEPIILDECCSSVTNEVQQANLEDMERIGMRIIRDDNAVDIENKLFK